MADSDFNLVEDFLLWFQNSECLNTVSVVTLSLVVCVFWVVTAASLDNKIRLDNSENTIVAQQNIIQISELPLCYSILKNTCDGLEQLKSLYQ